MVQHRAKLPSRGDAERSTRATLETLGERCDVDEFVARVASRSTTDEPVAAYRARVVFEVLGEATQGSVVQKVAEVLPGDVRRLVTAGSAGEV